MMKSTITVLRTPAKSVLAEDTQQGRIYIAEDLSASLPRFTLKQLQEEELAKLAKDKVI
jgi:hypothetical protein